MHTVQIDHPALAPGRVAVITGGARGIGLACAIRFARAGMRIMLADLDGLDEAAAGIAAAGGDVATHITDVADPAALAALRDATIARFDDVGLLMNNAAIGGGGDPVSNPEGWARVLAVNLHGVLHGTQAFASMMIDRGRPALIVNTGSKQGITGPPGDTAYNVSKAGVKMLTEGLAHSLRGIAGARVGAHLLIPGFTYTDMVARRLSQRPPGAWTAEQVADALVAGLVAGDFYILCADNETPRYIDERRILWAAGDLVENRPALSRWHPDWQDAFAAFVADRNG